MYCRLLFGKYFHSIITFYLFSANAAFPPGMMGGLGGMDINNLLNNPSLMNMATSMMSDPSVQQMMGQFMSGGAAQGGAPAGGGMEGLLQA